MRRHASQRHKAPNTILHGVPLKEVLGKDLIRLISETFADVHSEFDRKTLLAGAGSVGTSVGICVAT